MTPAHVAISTWKAGSRDRLWPVQPLYTLDSVHSLVWSGALALVSGTKLLLWSSLSGPLKGPVLSTCVT